MKKRILSFLISFIMLFSFTVTYAQETTDLSVEQQEADYSDIFTKTMIKVYAHELADNYFYGISDNELLYAVICTAVEEGKVDLNKSIEAMINALGDEHAEFYTNEEYNELAENFSGEFSGIGVVITKQEKGVLITSVLEDSPALESGIKEGDYITGINGTSVIGMDIENVRSMIVGAVSSTVSLTILRGTSTLEVVCVRRPVSVSNIETKMLTEDIAYLDIIQFAQNTPDEVEKYVKEIRKKSVKKLVLDLRNNPGGDLEAAIEIANIFISAGRIGELRYKDETLNTYIKSTNYHAPRFEMVVLVNENSASASEFLSMAIQSRGAGEILGTKTYGKGSMQVFKSLPNGTGIKYTVGEFYSPKGERIHTVGITPDIIVENEIVSVDEESFVEIDYNRMDEAGKTGEMNLALEQRLEALGFIDKADEIFDDATVQAVKDLQVVLGYDMTGVPGFYEYLYLNDFDYSFETVIDHQLESAIEFLSKK